MSKWAPDRRSRRRPFELDKPSVQPPPRRAFGARGGLGTYSEYSTYESAAETGLDPGGPVVSKS